MSENKNNPDNDNKRISIDDDYIELLNYTKSNDKYEDVYSNSSSYNSDKRYGSYESSSDDVYFSRSARNDGDERGYGDVYFNTNRRSDENRSGQPRNTHSSSRMNTGEIPRKNSVAPTPPPQKRKRLQDSDEISDYEARRKKIIKKKKKPVGVIILAVVLVLIIALGGSVISAVNGIVGKFEKADEIEHIEDVESLATDPNVKNILFIGTDKESGGASRADSIMIVSVNKKTGKITLCSILRDTHVDIPGEREAKINAAHTWGGAALLIKTVEQNFGIKIDDYATVNFSMFTELVDGLGGIDVEVTEAEANYINNVHRYKEGEKPDTVESGESVHLTGYQALWYSRIRKLDSDFMRTERQRKVITAIVQKAKSSLTPTGIFGLISTAKDVAPFVKTTLSTSDFWSLATSLVSCLSKSGSDIDQLVVSQKIPFDGTWWYESRWDGSSIIINLEKNKEILYNLLYGESTEDESETTTEEN